ncbi:unnamed protein product [Musa banksii]
MYHHNKKASSDYWFCGDGGERTRSTENTSTEEQFPEYDMLPTKEAPFSPDATEINPLCLGGNSEMRKENNVLYI